MRFLVKLAVSTAGVLCTTASAYLLTDEKKRYGVVFAASVPLSPSDNTTDSIKPPLQRSLSTPIQSSERWDWNWDGLVYILFCSFDYFIFLVVILK
jgi:hypothetical protein